MSFFRASSPREPISFSISLSLVYKKCAPKPRNRSPPHFQIRSPSSLCSRAAVVRGQVVTPTGMGLIGVRVSTTIYNEGFTMTRDDGWFDFMVNGGGSVMLQFGRTPYPPFK